jgi:N-acetylneuraminic acid mutarotase
MHIEEVKQFGQAPGSLVYHCSATIGKYVYVFLGIRPSGKNHMEVHIYNMETGRWIQVKATGKPPSPRCLSCCCAVGNKIYIFGGYQVQKSCPHIVFNGIYVFDTVEMKWEHLECKGLSPDPRAASCMVYYNNYLWIFGGSQGKQLYFGDLYKFNIEKKEWSLQETFGSKDKPHRLCCHTGVLVGNRMYIFGGLTADENYKNQRTTNEMYSIDLDIFTWRKEVQSGSIPSPRCCHACVAVRNLIFVAAGGDLLSRSKYDNHVYVCNTSQGNTWTKLTSYFGNYMPKMIGTTAAYDAQHHRMFFFGGKNQDNEIQGGVYELCLNKNEEIMKELKQQEIEEKELKILFNKLKKPSKDDALLQERDRLEIRSKHERIRSNSIDSIMKIKDIGLLTNANLEEMSKEELPIPDMIQFENTETIVGQGMKDAAPVSPEYSDSTMKRNEASLF